MNIRTLLVLYTLFKIQRERRKERTNEINQTTEGQATTGTDDETR